MTKLLEHVMINSQPIELCKLLKIANLVTGGGEAKIAITQGYVKVNDQFEYQKRKKIVSDDIIEFNGEKILVVFQPSTEKKQVKTEQKSVQVEKKKVTANNNIQQSTSTNKPTKKRKPISF